MLGAVSPPGLVKTRVRRERDELDDDDDPEHGDQLRAVGHKPRDEADDARLLSGFKA
jgi:hypothetical protein